MKNDPSLMYNADVTHTDSVEKQPSNTFKGRVNNKKTTVCQQTDTWNFKECKPEAPVCVIHKGPGVKHGVNDCRVFSLKLIEERRKILRENGLCFRRCSGTHRKAECKENFKRKDCGSGYHTTTLRVDTLPASTDRTPTIVHGGEEAPKEQHVTTINSKCTEVGKDFKGKSCARIVPATVTYQGKAVSLYVTS